ncbi:glycerophosphodiester phosphodiesterase [Alteromonas oceanisediminis]|uniref:glycerophosphodiester phosphodiesterase n=1 Tax=Alteromonas oceanisediminis TaxID=2836180 RepID=UPI001BDADEA5|nr:glycerophosphodiester phosphodiesterase [Alteromonas oceanisediminis]MBT0584817.1 glycerophosphodiester phosphodiesterase [Alteromonas oceanisediminis]
MKNIVFCIIAFLCIFGRGAFADANESSQSNADHAKSSPSVVAHRGASGYLPEHTLEAAVLAYNQGADYIEQDLVLSQDNVLIVLHDIHLERTTDVEHQFPNRAREDGRFYAIDFTLAELKQLHVHERANADGSLVFPNRYKGQAAFSLATFEEHIALVNTLNQVRGRNVGLYPEIKAPAWHRAEGKDISSQVLTVLKRHGYADADDPVLLQCFDFNEIKRIRHTLNSELRLIQLLAENSWQESNNDYDYLKTNEGLAEIAAVAQGIGPWFPHVYDVERSQATSLVTDAKKHGLLIHPYTFRADQLPANMTAPQTLDILFKQLEVDGVFTDHTDTVVGYLRRQRAETD